MSKTPGRALKSPPAARRQLLSHRAEHRPPQLHIGRPDSPWEHEARRLSDRAPPKPLPIAPTPAHADAPSASAQPTAAHPGLGPSPPSSETSAFHPLPTALRHHLEARCGFDLSGVRVVTGSAAAQAAALLQARAFTQHGRIHLGASATLGDEALLTHEITHVLQQALPAAELARVGLTPAPADAILRQPISATPFADRHLARDSLEDPFSMPVWVLPSSLFATLDWIGDDGLRMRLTRAIPEALNPTLNLLRRLGPLWGYAQREAHVMAAAGRTWDEIAELVTQTDDPTLLKAARRVASNLPGLFNDGWSTIRRIIDVTVEVARHGVAHWEGGLSSLDPATADHLNTLGRDVTAVFNEFAGESWVIDALRTALGCPGTLRDANAVTGWINGVRDSADHLIEDLAQRANRLTTAQFDTAEITRITAQAPGARALSSDLATVVRLLDKPDGVILERDQLEPVLPRLHQRMASLDFALTLPAQEFGHAFDGLGFDLQSWGSAPALVFFPNEFDWMANTGSDVEGWLSHQEPSVLVSAEHSLEGIDHWTGLVAETVDEEKTLDEDVPMYDSGFASWLKRAWAWVRDKKKKVVAKLMAKVPLLKELKEHAADLWARAQTAFERFKERIFKEGRILAPLWDFFLDVLGLVLPMDFIRDVATRAGSLLGKILKHPIEFLRNLAKGISHGLYRFGQNIGNHLLNSLLEWLLGEFNLQPPVTFGKIIGALMEQIGFTRMTLCERIAEYLKGKGKHVTAAQVNEKLERAIKIGATALHWLKLLYQGKYAEFWQEIKQYLVRLWQWVVDKAVAYVIDQVKKQLLKWLIQFLDPTGIMVVIKTIKAIYDAIRTVIQYAERIFAIVREVFQAVREIADGQIDRAAEWVENAAAKALTVLIAFVARLVGLDSIVAYFKHALGEVKKLVIAGMDKLIELTGDVWDWLVAKAEQAKEWWQNRRSFTDTDGAKRTIYYEERGPDKEQVLVLSPPEVSGQANILKTPETLDDFIRDFRPANARERKIVDEIRNLAGQIDHIKQGSVSARKGEEIHVLFNEIVVELEKLGGRVAPPATDVDWDPETIDSEAHGGTMNAKRLTTDPGGNIGSEPVASDTKLWASVKGYQRGNASAYIRGHLLNHHLHGPGVWKNMAPIARTTNSKMERIAESDVKKAVIGENKVVHYRVEMNYKSYNPKGRTAAEKKLPVSISMFAEELKYQRGNWVASGTIIVPQQTLENELR